jgi:signal transduction histidine kinase
VRRANQIITDLLDFARIRPAIPHDVNVAYVIGQAVGGAASNPQVELATEVDDGLAVRCDAEQLQTALFNLVRHACESMVDGGRLRIAARPEGERCVIDLSDTGPGLPEDVLEQLRDPLAVRERRVTLGLQLMTARALVENQQGTFAVESSAAGGTHYTLRVALA